MKWRIHLMVVALPRISIKISIWVRANTDLCKLWLWAGVLHPGSIFYNPRAE